jgi:hypothetical protein
MEHCSVPSPAFPLITLITQITLITLIEPMGTDCTR